MFIARRRRARRPCHTGAQSGRVSAMRTMLGLAGWVAGLLLALTTAVTAQDYPTKPLRLIIPFPPGGLNDVVGRIVATQLGERLGKQVIVDNRSGAGGVVGTEMVANAP